MIELLLLQVAAPAIVSVSPPVSGRAADGPSVTRSPILVATEVIGGGKVLWRGTLRIGAQQGARFSQNLSQPADQNELCAEPQRASSTAATSLSINMTRQTGAPIPPNTVQVEVNWLRSTDPTVCGFYQTPSRTTSLSEAVTVSRTAVTELRGDGGLVVRLRLEP